MAIASDKDSINADKIIDSLSIINNWRSSHSYPLQTLKMTLLSRANKIDHSAIIAQRLKRLPSISSKLQQARNQNMKLSQMQDIGGCRAVEIKADAARIKHSTQLQGST